MIGMNSGIPKTIFKNEDAGYFTTVFPVIL
jgi:hypothetical protein